VNRRKLISGISLSSALTSTLLAQTRRPKSDLEIEDPLDRRLPNGRTQRDMILEDKHKRAIADSQRLADLAAEMKAQFEKETRWVVSMEQVKRWDEIDKLVKRLRVAVRGLD
jgi:hypothetical protein